MKRIVRRFFTCASHDALLWRRRERTFGDEILEANPVGKTMLMPMTWRGDLEPVLDTYLEQPSPLKGFMLGHVVHAEEIGHVLDLGRVWLGDFTDRVRASSNDQPGAVDASEVLKEIEDLRTAMGTRDPKMIADAFRRVRDASSRLGRDAEEEHGAFSEGRRIADAAVRHVRGTTQRIKSINQRNADFWRERSVTPTLDSSGSMNSRTRDSARGAETTAFRDAAHQARTATTTRSLVEAMNNAAKSLWSGGEPPTLTSDALRRMSATAGDVTQAASSRVASINAANRAFWAERS
jgi:hypothetical protein